MQEAIFDAVLPRLLPFAMPPAIEALAHNVSGLRDLGRIYTRLQAMGGARR
jgi:hypothetical protein